MLRPCIEPQCRQLTPRTRCVAHERQADRARQAKRGDRYGPEHRAARRELAETLPRYCAYGCGTWLTAADPWVAAHVDDRDPSAGWMAACSPCNSTVANKARAGRT